MSNSEMRLYHLTVKDYNYDEFDEAIVRASSPGEAREIAEKELDDDRPGIWLDSSTTCVVVPLAGETGVVLSSFNAG